VSGQSDRGDEIDERKESGDGGNENGKIDPDGDASENDVGGSIGRTHGDDESAAGRKPDSGEWPGA
jgi:hypothetical protein